MYLSAQAAIHKLGGLNKRNLFLHISVNIHGLSSVHVQRERELSDISSYKDNHFIRLRPHPHELILLYLFP